MRPICGASSELKKSVQEYCRLLKKAREHCKKCGYLTGGKPHKCPPWGGKEKPARRKVDSDVP